MRQSMVLFLAIMIFSSTALAAERCSPLLGRFETFMVTNDIGRLITLLGAPVFLPVLLTMDKKRRFESCG